MKKIDVNDFSFAHLTLILLLHYLVKSRSRSLAVLRSYWKNNTGTVFLRHGCNGPSSSPSTVFSLWFLFTWLIFPVLRVARLVDGVQRWVVSWGHARQSLGRETPITVYLLYVLGLPLTQELFWMYTDILLRVCDIFWRRPIFCNFFLTTTIWWVIVYIMTLSVPK